MPIGIREQPAWLFIGFIVVMSGVGYVSGQTTSAIIEAIGSDGLRAWGVSMVFSGLLVMVATANAKPSLEKFALRILSCNILAYVGWVAVVVPLNRIGATIMMGMALVAVAESRARHLTELIRRTEILNYELRRHGNGH